ncbi:MAG TPA: chorismate-binding protein [Candidatus Omnitrophota bacterium]|nr:chorismate-binding protein [Candidatus Omnitrophota bacterium]HPT07133.1 chorismate-binding protein [Candidatus Omnitrophota bacterium]
MITLIQFYKKPLLFEQPLSIITTCDPLRLADCFERIEEALRRRCYCAGFVSYEAGYAFEKKLCQQKHHDFPLLCVGVYKSPRIGLPQWSSTHYAHLGGLRLSLDRRVYDEHIQIIRRHIKAGDVYQITYCIKLFFDFYGSAYSLYQRLVRAQPVPYPAYIETDFCKILSLSPELFLHSRGREIISKPMKGTWQRGRNPLSDTLQRFRFRCDAKNRAENVMITDLLRNDFGRISARVRVPRLFEITPYKTLFQMTSTVRARLALGYSVYRLFQSLFPSGSVTGAPKIRAMEIIRQLEGRERKIYTGAIGYITPDRDVFFNIPIRTLLLGKDTGEMGIGGGIVWDSTPDGEWDEGLLKARFVTDLFKSS